MRIGQVNNMDYLPLAESTPYGTMHDRPNVYDVFGDEMCCPIHRGGIRKHGNARVPKEPHTPYVRNDVRLARRRKSQRAAIDATRNTHATNVFGAFGYKVYVSGRLAGHMYLLAGVVYWRDYLPSGRFAEPEVTRFTKDPSQIGRAAIADFLGGVDPESIRKWPLK